MAAVTSYEDALLTFIRLLHVTILAFVDGTNNSLTTNDWKEKHIYFYLVDFVQSF